MQTKSYCCQQIDNENNKWIDCHPCNKTKAPCLTLTKNDCEQKDYQKYCSWDHNKCIPKENTPEFAKEIKPCDKSFSNNVYCITPRTVPGEEKPGLSNLYFSSAPKLMDYLGGWILPIVIILFLLVVYLLLRPPRINSTIIL